MKIIYYLSILPLLAASYTSSAQDKNNVKFGKITPQDFVLPVSAVIDSSSNAVIMADAGITTFKGNDKGWVSYIFKRKTRIKILNKKAFDLATVKIKLYTDGDAKEKLENFTAAAYNLENGLVVPTKMERNDLFTDKIDKHIIEQKFTVPGVRENSIIEYSYTIQSDFYFNIPEWSFQNIDYPCLWSEYEVTIPSLVGYVFMKRGVHSFFIDKADDGHESYLLRKQNTVGTQNDAFSISASTVKHRWVMKDIPALYIENYLFTPENYIDQIEFQLSQTFDGENTHEVKNSWSKLTEDMLKAEDFASFITEENANWWLDKHLETIVKSETDKLQQANEIYHYLSNNFTCTNYHRKFIETTLQDVFKKQKGNVGEINLLLTGMLLRKHIAASPVLLSTRPFGYNYANYPVLGRLDYVICKAIIDNKVYYLDASRPSLGFGHLPPDCYNGHARVISATDSSSVYYFMADSINEWQTSFVRIINDTAKKGELQGNYESALGYMGSYALRESVNDGGEKKYIAALQSGAGEGLEITEASIDSLKKTEFPVKLRAAFTINADKSTDIIYFNPILWGEFKNNPFHAADRKYPVEMSYPVNQVYVLNMETPEGFVIDEIPKSAKVSFNNGEGSFEYMVQKNELGVQLRSVIHMKKAWFSADEYNSLRDFFGYIVKKQGEQIVFKRKR